MDARDAAGNTALIRAILGGNFPVAMFLVSRGADVNCTNVEGLTPLRLAIDWDADAELMLAILRAGSLRGELVGLLRRGIPTELLELSIKCEDADLSTSLFAVSFNGLQPNWQETARWLIMHGADPNLCVDGHFWYTDIEDEAERQEAIALGEECWTPETHAAVDGGQGILMQFLLGARRLVETEGYNIDFNILEASFRMLPIDSFAPK